MARFVRGGKLYDTETATQIGVINDQSIGGTTRTLFVTPKGAFFLHVVSPIVFGETSETSYPMTPEGARVWAETYLTSETVCRFFEVEEA